LYFHKTFFDIEPDFDICAELQQKKMLKRHVAQFGIIPTSEFLYLIANHATSTGAIKAVVHAVNMTFRKLKKNNVRNTDKT